MRKLIHITAGAVALVLLTSVASAVPVTFSVDMQHQPAFNASTNTVELRGGFNGWSGGWNLTNVTGTAIYTNTFDITGTAGTWVQYKFFVGYSTALSWEPIGGWHPGGNRAFQLPGTAAALTTAFFGDQWPGGGAGVEVRFSVNMSAQIGAGFFSAADTMKVQGAFNNAWGTIVLTNVPATDIYAGAYLETVRPVGTFIEHKYMFTKAVGGDVWESIVGYPDNNRAFILDVGPVQTLPTVYFADTSGFPIKAGIVFQTDLSQQVLVDQFNPAIDQVWIRGNAMGWDAPPSGLQLFEDTARPGIYTNRFNIENQLTGAAFEFKYTLWRNNTTTVWEDGDNKSVSWTGTEPMDGGGYRMITNGPTPFNNFIANTNDILPADTLVTFTVDMNPATTQNLINRTNEIVFDPTQMDVFVNGDFANWWDWNAPELPYQLHESVPGSLIYTNTILVPKGKKVALTYKFAVDTWFVDQNPDTDNELPYGQNHVRYVRTVGGTTVLPQDTWASPVVEPVVGDVTISGPTGGYVTLNWRGRPGVHLQESSNLSDWSDVPDTYAASTASLPASTGPKFYRLQKP